MQINPLFECVTAEASKQSGIKGQASSNDDANSVHSEVVPRSQRRRFSSSDKKRILEATKRCTKSGEIGALTHRGNVCFFSLSSWRRQRESAGLKALASKKRGPKPDEARIDAHQLEQMTRQRDRLDKARLVINAPKKLAALLGTPFDEETR